MIFKELYNLAPQELKETIDDTKRVNQSPIWHIEGDVHTHTEIVTNRLSKYNDINLSLAGIFHDLGKIDTTVWNEEKSTWSAHNHELISVEYVNKYSNWIVELGGDTVVINDIVINHMRIKYFDEMKYSKKVSLVSNKHFDLIRKFETADYGGFDTVCRQPIDVKTIQEKIKKSKLNYLQRFFDTFYIRGVFIVKMNKFYVFKTKKPYIVEVKSGIRSSNRIQIKL